MKLIYKFAGASVSLSGMILSGYVLSDQYTGDYFIPLWLTGVCIFLVGIVILKK